MTPEESRAYYKAYREANMEKVLAREKAYREANKEKIKARKKAYYEANKKKKKVSDKAYREANKEKIKALQKAYREANKEKAKNYHKTWREDNKEKMKSYYKAYREANRERLCEKDRIYQRTHKEDRKNYYSKEYNNNPEFKLRMLLRSRLNRAIKNSQKTGSAVHDLGCSVEYLKAYLEGQFEPGMSWENHGEWHIDHIVPLASFDLTDREQLLKACHYTNLQPLWAKDNLSKGDSI